MEMGSLRVAAIAAMIVCSGSAAARAQDAGQQPTKPAMMAKDADPDWDVVTVKASDPNDRVSGDNFVGSRYVIEQKSVEQMLSLGFKVHRRQIVGAPEWAANDHWDVSGVPDVAGEPDQQQRESMVRKLLAERFGLKAHHEQREMPAYALVLAKGGPKLTPSAHDPKEVPDQSGSGNSVREAMKYTNNSMADLANGLQEFADRPVVDRTGFSGRYDFKLQWTRDETRTTSPDAPPGLFTAIQEELGLKLEPVKAPVDVLVVDKVERPGAN
jgi:uncharacterized protein (TIGR03435 family)